jgi:hypothetical protein
MVYDLKGSTPESWCCVDCGINTLPGCPSRIEMEQHFNGKVLKLEPTKVTVQYNEHCEVYMVRDSVWKAAGVEEMGGCLCVGCLEQRIGRKLRPRDFTRHPFNSMPGTERLMQRRGGAAWSAR